MIIKDPCDAINFIVEQRRNFNWNIKLPVNGRNIRMAMETYQDRIDTDTSKTLDDDGQFRYCLCISDIKQNILYSPYELRVTTGSIAKKNHVYYTVSASYITKVFNIGYGETQIIPVMRWLWEKKYFDALRRIRVFNLFRKRRTFKCWLVYIREAKQLRARYTHRFYFV